MGGGVGRWPMAGKGGDESSVGATKADRSLKNLTTGLI